MKKQQKELNLAETAKLYSKVLEIGKANQQTQNKILLIIGTAQSGKTTMQYLLSDQKLIFVTNQDTLISSLLPQNIYEDAHILQVPVDVTTLIPNLKNVQNANQQLTLIDVPDLSIRSSYQQFLIKCYLKLIFSTFKKIHILLVLPKQSISSTADVLDQISYLQKILDFQDDNFRQSLKNCISIVLNKIQDDIQIQTFKQIVEDQIKQENELIYQILSTVIEQNRLFYVQSKQVQPNYGSELLSSINKCQYKQLTLSLSKIKTFSESIDSQIFCDQYISSFPQFFAPFLQFLRYFTKPSEQTYNQLRLNNNYNFQLMTEKPASLKKAVLTFLIKFQNPNESFKVKQLRNQITNLQQAFIQFSQNYSEYIQFLKQQALIFNFFTQIYQLYFINHNSEDFQKSVSEVVAKLLQQFKEYIRENSMASPQRKVKKSQIKKPVQLKQAAQQFWKQHNTGQRLDHINRLPPNYFKLHLLFTQFSQLTTKYAQALKMSDSTASIFKKIKFATYQISKILQLHQHYLQSIYFLLVIPDFNRIQEIVSQFKDYFQPGSLQNENDLSESKNKQLQSFLYFYVLFQQNGQMQLKQLIQRILFTGYKNDQQQKSQVLLKIRQNAQIFEISIPSKDLFIDNGIKEYILQVVKSNRVQLSCKKFEINERKKYQIYEYHDWFMKYIGNPSN